MRNIYEMLIGAPPSGPEETAAAARALRGRQDLGTVGMLSGDRVVAPIGEKFFGSAQDQMKELQDTRQRDAQRGVLQGYYAAQGEYNTARLGETARHNRAMEEIYRLQALIDRERARKLGSGKTPPNAVQENAMAARGLYQGLESLYEAFEDDYASETGPLGGSLTNALGRTPLSSDAMKAQADWWSQFDLLYTLPRRNELFGSALTETERLAWEQANVPRNAPPEVVRRGLVNLMNIARGALRRQQLSYGSLYVDEWADKMYGDLDLDPLDPESVLGKPASKPEDIERQMEESVKGPWSKFGGKE